ncbi:MAG TPA: SDR family oxidoreductase [Actinomycetota bacterium]|jgi:NAD(P)-dependent dehydrogenase (short-subunit alcohol dehydrogenase family)|nr:SDR family oxidoreductase [Actinomycetota bacterium]
MDESGTVVIVGGTQGIGRELAQHYADLGQEVVISGRDEGRAKEEADAIGGRTVGVGFDLARPHEIAPKLSGVQDVRHLVLAAIERDTNSVRDYDIDQALRLVTLKLVGYTECIHALLPRMGPESSILLFGGLAKDRPYPGSTTVTSVNGAVTTMVRTLVVELAPIRVNALHPGIVGDSPTWKDRPEVLERVLSRTPTGRMVMMRDVVEVAVLLLENRSVNGINVEVDGGWMAM